MGEIILIIFIKVLDENGDFQIDKWLFYFVYFEIACNWNYLNSKHRTKLHKIKKIK